MENISRERLEEMADTLANVCLWLADSQLVEKVLRTVGFSTEELKALGFDIEE